MFGLKLAGLAGVVALVIAGYALFERGNRIAADARSASLSIQLAQAAADLIAARENAETAARLSASFAQSAAARQAEVAALEEQTRDLMDLFRQQDRVCAFERGELDRLRDITIRTPPAVAAPPGAGLIRQQPVPRPRRIGEP